MFPAERVRTAAVTIGRFDCTHNFRVNHTDMPDSASATSGMPVRSNSATMVSKEPLMTAYDPKFSDGGAWRGSCVVERSEGIRAKEKGGSDETGSS